MKNHASRLIVPAAALALLSGFVLAAAMPAWSGGVLADPAPRVCEDFRYSDCPSSCFRECVPTACGPDGCTADCDGPRSCRTPGWDL